MAMSLLQHFRSFTQTIIVRIMKSSFVYPTLCIRGDNLSVVIILTIRKNRKSSNNNFHTRQLKFTLSTPILGDTTYKFDARNEVEIPINRLSST